MKKYGAKKGVLLTKKGDALRILYCLIAMSLLLSNHFIEVFTGFYVMSDFYTFLNGS